MLTPVRTGAARLRREQGGFTLIETLVAIVSGMAVMGALFTVLEVALHQSSRQADLAQASQLGRLAMTRVVDTLHSTCLAAGFTPVQSGSSASKLIVVDGYSEGTEFSGAATTLSGARRDTIYWKETGKSLGKLWDSTELAASGAPPATVGGASTFTWNAPTTVMLAENVAATTLEEEGKKLPFFKYYKYATKSTTGTGEASTTLTKVEPPAEGFKAEEAKQIAAVQVSFRTLPSDGNQEAARSINLTNQVTFALSAPSSEATIEAGPCE